MYFPVDGGSADRSVGCLAGRHLVDVDSSAAPGSWVFRFGADCRLDVGGTWRLIDGGRITISGGDHQQLRKAPARSAGTEVVAAELLSQLLVAVHDPQPAPNLRLGRASHTSAYRSSRKEGEVLELAPAHHVGLLSTCPATPAGAGECRRGVRAVRADGLRRPTWPSAERDGWCRRDRFSRLAWPAGRVRTAMISRTAVWRTIASRCPHAPEV